MGKYTPLHKKIWRDKDFKKSSKDGKILFVYLISNESINNSGIYEIPLSTISDETGIGCSTVAQLLAKGSIRNILYDVENEIVFVVNRRKYSPGGNPAQVEKGIISEFQQTSKSYLWTHFLELNPQFKNKFPTVAQPLPNGSIPLPVPVPIEVVTNSKPLKMEKEKEILEYLNLRAKKKYKPTPKNLEHISARYREDYSVDDFKRVIDCKVDQWKGSHKMDKYLRPSTLFNPTNFPAYANEMLPAGSQVIEEIDSRPLTPSERVRGEPKLEKLWEDILEKIKAEILPESYETWFRSSYPRTFEAGVLMVAVPNQFTRKAMIENYRELIESAAKEIEKAPVLVEFCIEVESVEH